MAILMVHVSELVAPGRKPVSLEEAKTVHLPWPQVRGMYEDAHMTVVFEGDRCKILTSRFGREGVIMSLADLMDFSPWHTATLIHKRATIKSLLQAGDGMHDALTAIANGGDLMAAEYALNLWVEKTKEYIR